MFERESFEFKAWILKIKLVISALTFMSSLNESDDAAIFFFFRCFFLFSSIRWALTTSLHATWIVETSILTTRNVSLISYFFLLWFEILIFISFIWRFQVRIAVTSRSRSRLRVSKMTHNSSKCLIVIVWSCCFEEMSMKFTTLSDSFSSSSSSFWLKFMTRKISMICCSRFLILRSKTYTFSCVISLSNSRSFMLILRIKLKEVMIVNWDWIVVEVEKIKKSKI